MVFWRRTVFRKIVQSNKYSCCAPTRIVILHASFASYITALIIKKYYYSTIQRIESKHSSQSSTNSGKRSVRDFYTALFKFFSVFLLYMLLDIDRTVHSQTTTEIKGKKYKAYITVSHCLNTLSKQLLAQPHAKSTCTTLKRQ